MPRYLPFSRRQLRSRFAAWVRSNRSVVTLLGAGALVLVLVETWLLLGFARALAFNAYVLGVIHTATVATLLYALCFTFLAHDREAIFHLRGAWGEEHTRDELKRAKRKKLVWGWVDSLTLASGDIDHLVVTRSGGLVALDSKWRNRADVADRDAMVRSARRANVRAEGVMRTLPGRERGGHRAALNPLRVRPAIVIWGAWQHDVPIGARVEGVDFIRGRHLVSWLAALDGEPVDSDAGKDLLRGLETFRAGAWPSEVRHQHPSRP